MTDENSSGQFSVKLCNVLKVMGYSYTQIKKRQDYFENVQNLENTNRANKNDTFFIAGSKKEGLSYLEVDSDIDVMVICNHLRCYQMNDSALRSQVDGITYILQYEGCPPGYAMLEVDEHSNDDHNAIFYIRSAKTNKRYFSSEIVRKALLTTFMDGMNKQQDIFHRGPLPTKSFISQFSCFKGTYLIERLNRSTGQKLNTTQNEHAEMSNHIFMNSEMELVKQNIETQKSKNSKTGDELQEQDDVEIIYNRKGLVDSCQAKADESVENEQIYHFEDDRNLYSRIYNADIADGKPKSNEPSQTKYSSSVTENSFFIPAFESFSQKGPSLTLYWYYKHPIFTCKSQDFVIALPALCQDYIHDWATKTRYQNFPTVEQIERISKMEAHVVPISCKETPDADLQWRICFTLGEVELIQSLNGTQLKLLVLLRMLAKNVIKPECPEIITSYVMKNVVLWMAELKPRDHFREENLENCLIEAVHFLSVCVRNGFLPNYMIHSRNLLQGRLSLQDRGILLKLLGSLVKEKGMMVMRCDKLRHNLNCPYISRFFTYAGNHTQLCVDIFQKFLEPTLLNELTDMEDVFAEFLTSVERGIDQQTSVVKLQSMVILKSIKSWITKIPYKSPDQIEKRSLIRRKCGELKQRIAKSAAGHFSGNQTYRLVIKLIIFVLENLINETIEEEVDVENVDCYEECLAMHILTFIDSIVTLDNMWMLNIYQEPKQTAAATYEVRRMDEKHSRQKRQYSDLDLD